VSFIFKNVVVIGGGFSGTVLAAQLLRRAPHLSLAVVDKNPVPARGLAYGTDYECHLLNVPVEDMSAFPDEPDHFYQWAKGSYELPVQRGDYLPRWFYGCYLGALIEDAIAASPADFDWIADEATSLQPERDGFLLQRKTGPAVVAQHVVLALGNFPPGNLGIPGLSEHARCYERRAWSKSALSNLSPGGDVLLIGSGLTAVDIAIALDSRSFNGTIHILSRHGLLPQSHKPSLPWPAFWNQRSPQTVRGLLYLIRNQAESASASGSDWRAVMDSLRPQVQQIWISLPLRERRRFLRHARAYWEVHRHRVAPQIAGKFYEMMASGQVQIHAGRITEFSESDASEKRCSENNNSGPENRRTSATVIFRERRTGKVKELQVSRVINCSGPETDCRKIDSPILKNLFELGLARQDSLSLGLDTDQSGALVDANGIASRSLFAVGPVRKGLLWESTAVPELRVQAANLANHLAAITLQQDAVLLPAESRAAR
jgi:uncharacterized NAD(P)/FAD-binding protein YdhS